MRKRPWKTARRRYPQALRKNPVSVAGLRPHTKDPVRDACAVCGRTSLEIIEHRVTWCDGVPADHAPLRELLDG